MEEARKKQVQEFVDVQHITELEEMDELAPTPSSKDIDEEELATEEEPAKEEGSVSDILPFGLYVANSETRVARFQIPRARY